MAHIKSIGAAVYTDLAIAMPLTKLTADQLAQLDTAAEFQALFGSEIPTIGGTKAANTFVRVKNVREFPAIGTPANPVNVPVYGQPTSSQITGQSDAQNFDITLNYVPADLAKGTLLGDAIGDDEQYVFRFVLMNRKPTDFIAGATGIGSVPNTEYFFVGKLSSLQITPNLTDATQATLSIAVQSQFFGAYTE